MLLTLTIRHHRGQRLADLWETVARSFSRLTAGRPWKTFKSAAKLVGHLRVAEVTYGEAAGWHVHLHILLYLDAGGDQFAAHLAALGARQGVLAAWRRIVERRGYSAVDDALDMRPVNLADGENALGGYFQKCGWDAADEVARGASKQARRGNRTPMAILRDFAEHGDVDDLELWREWEKGSKGRRQMTWSRGLRQVLALSDDLDDADLAADIDDGAETTTDEQIVDSLDRGDDAVLVLDAATWRHVRSSSLVYELLEKAEQARDDPSLIAMLRYRLAYQ